MESRCFPEVEVRYFEDDYDFEEHAKQYHHKVFGDEAPTIEPELLNTYDMSSNVCHQVVAEIVWDGFYKRNGTKFFKLKKYLWNAFPEIGEKVCKLNEVFVAEFGCGHGAAVIPILNSIIAKHKNVRKILFHGYDISPTTLTNCKEALNDSIDIRTTTLEFNVRFTVADITTNICIPENDGFEKADILLMMFTISGIMPEMQLNVFENAFRMLNPGGILCIRDYGVFDMVHLRCQKRVDDFTYIKSDGVLVTFFTTDRLKKLGEDAGLKCERIRYCCNQQTNRKTGTHLKRVMVNAVFIKPQVVG